MADNWSPNVSEGFSPPEDSHQHELSQEDISQKKKKKKNRAWKLIVAVIVFAIVIVFVSLLLTVFFVDDFNTLGELINYIRAQY